MVDEPESWNEHARAASVRSEQAARRGFRRAHPAVWVTALVLGALALVGFGVLAGPYVRSMPVQRAWTVDDELAPLPFSLRLVALEYDEWYETQVWTQREGMLACPDRACIEALFSDVPVPAGTQVAYEHYRCYSLDAPMPVYMPVLVEERVRLGPGDVESAGPERNELMDGAWETAISLTPTGSDEFTELTREHVGRRAAVFLGDQLVTAPRILEPILSGRFRISLPRSPSCAPNDEASARRYSAAIMLAARQVRHETRGDR